MIDSREYCVMPNDYPVREYTQVSGNGNPLTRNGEGEDIVYTETVLQTEIRK